MLLSLACAAISIAAHGPHDADKKALVRTAVLLKNALSALGMPHQHATSVRHLWNDINNGVGITIH
jgi:hypothetical protein